MSDSSKTTHEHHAPSDAMREKHGIPEGKVISGHKIIVEGFYFAWDKKLGEKLRRSYREKFTLRAREHKAAPQGALGHILSDSKLTERLSAKDPEFRAIQTHTVVAHENILVDAAAKPKKPAAKKHAKK